MGFAMYYLTRAAFAVPRAAAVRECVLNKERADRAGPFILAVSHLSHLEPAFVSCHVKRHVRWMARVEHYHSGPAALFLRACGAFSVDRFNNPAPAVRLAIGLLRDGQVVGIFPEGGNTQGPSSVLRGGPIRGGAATLAIATGAPIVPVVVLGTEKLNRALPWMPTRSASIWMAFGPELGPPPRSDSLSTRRQRRLHLTAQLQLAFVQTYQHLLASAGLHDRDIP